jgi:phosphatidylglycerophosphatase A
LIVVLVAFAAFRVFDILKPPPCRQLEKYPFGWGVLLDDLMAGVYANMVAQILLRFLIPRCMA